MTAIRTRREEHTETAKVPVSDLVRAMLNQVRAWWLAKKRRKR